MAIWTKTTKNSSTWTKAVRNNASWTKSIVSGFLGYLLTPDSNYILVGTASDEFLIFSNVTSWTKLNKS